LPVWFIHGVRERPASSVIAPLAKARSAKQSECEDMEYRQDELRGLTELQRVILVTTDLKLDEDKRCDSDGGDQSCCNECADQGPFAVPDNSKVEPDGHGEERHLHERQRHEYPEIDFRDEVLRRILSLGGQRRPREPRG